MGMVFGPSIKRVDKRVRVAVNLLVMQMIFALMPWFIYFFVSGWLNYAMGPVLAISAYLVSPSSFRMTAKNMGIFTLLFLAAMLGTSGNMNAYIGTLFRCIPFLMFMAAKQEVRIEVVNTFSKWYVWILGVSLFFWILYLIGTPLPNTHLDLIGDNTYEFDNYYFFTRNTSWFYADSFFPRFNSIFLEPGYIACFIVLMLLLDHFDFRKRRNIIYLAALIMTFSLAGWLFFFLALAPYLSRRGRVKWAYFAVLSLVIGAFVYFNFSNESNAVNKLIGERLKVEDGRMVGYNRANEEVRALWENGFIFGPDALWGLRERYFSSHDFGASVDSRAYIIRFGIIAFLFYVWFLIRSLRAKWSSKGLWMFIIVALFAYRGYSIMFNDALLFVYIGSLEALLLEQNVKKIQKLNERNKFCIV